MLKLPPPKNIIVVLQQCTPHNEYLPAITTYMSSLRAWEADEVGEGVGVAVDHEGAVDMGAVLFC